MDHGETTKALVSYGIGLGSITIAQVAETAHTLTIFAGLLVVSVRLVHDGVRLYRYLKKKGAEE